MKGNNSNTEFSAPITEWHDDRIVAGIGPISQEFKIDSPAKRGKGGWKMTINGHELRRK